MGGGVGKKSQKHVKYIVINIHAKNHKEKEINTKSRIMAIISEDKKKGRQWEWAHKVLPRFGQVLFLKVGGR